MSDNGEHIPSPTRPTRLADLAEAAGPADQHAPSSTRPAAPTPAPVEPAPKTAAPSLDELTAARRRFAMLLGEFRRTAVLVPLDASGSLWTADQGGVRWICAFSDEHTLATFARAQGEAGREWTYQRVLGARLLDVMVPLLPGPGGVALDAGSADGMLFPPVPGVVPDTAAVDVDAAVDLEGSR
ncbi:SseB family protein [Streptomyces sp. NPDC098789]|uniref:SseB family protein n=1 Tax=Streptomyces sp. NPDC098789 TaxID=3366098 RepID=UPI00381109FA